MLLVQGHFGQLHAGFEDTFGKGFLTRRLGLFVVLLIAFKVAPMVEDLEMGFVDVGTE